MAVASKSANPAVMAPGGVGVDVYRSHGEYEVRKWALKSSRHLERLLEALTTAARASNPRLSNNSAVSSCTPMSLL